MQPHDPFFDGPRGMFLKTKPQVVEVKLSPGQTEYRDGDLQVNIQPSEVMTTITICYKTGSVLVDPPTTVNLVFTRTADYTGANKLALKPRPPKQNYLNLRKGRWNQ